MTLNCPTCAVALSQRSVDGETIDHCNVCNGAWYDPSEFSSLLSNSTATDSSDHRCANPLEKIACPQCKIEISATIYAHDSGIPILKCTNCSGIWLVAGQFESIVKYRNGPHKTDRLGQAMAESYAQSNALNGFARLIQSRVLSTIFAVAILIIATMCGADAAGVLRLLAFLILPMACIWFSDAMGNTTGIRMGLTRPMITQSTPGIAVALGGWFLMFAVFGVMIYQMIGR